MIRPDEVELMSFFESDILSKDDLKTVPFEYNFSTFTFQISNIENIEFSIYPAYEEVYLTYTNESKKFSIALKNVSLISIVFENGDRKIMRIESHNSSTEIQLKPQILISHFEETNH